MLPIPKGTQEEEKKGTRPLTCPYCDDSPFIKILTDESLAFQNRCLNEGRENIPILANDGFVHRRTEKYNYDRGLFCDKCKTTWLWEGNVVDTYVGKDVPRVREVVIIGGKAYMNYLPIKDRRTEEYMPLLHPFAPLVKRLSK